MMRTNQAAVLCITLLLPAIAASCTEDGPPTQTGSSGSTSSGEMSSSSSSGSGGAGGAGGAAGAGGSGGSMAAAPGHTATEFVSGGQFMKSGNYSMIYTIGQPSQIQSTATSDKYRMQGGIVGATGSLK